MSEETTEGRGAVAGQVQQPVRPCAWIRNEYEGPATLAPLMFLGDAEVKPYSDLHGATYEPLYSAAALADAVAAEREQCLADCEAVGDLGAALVAQRIRDRA